MTGVQTCALPIYEVCEQGEVDFVTDVAAKLPLRIVCDLMGIPRSRYDEVFARTNVILGFSDPEYVPDEHDIVTATLTAGGELAALMDEVAASKRGGDGQDLTSVLVNAELEGDTLDAADLASFFILLVVAGLAHGSSAFAQVYKCTGADGRTAYSDKPCATPPGAPSSASARAARTGRARTAHDDSG